MTDLINTKYNLKFMIKLLLADIEKNTCLSKYCGRELTTLALHYRQLGILELLRKNDKNYFVECLMKSTQARLEFLKSANKVASVNVKSNYLDLNDEKYRTTIQNRSFFDSIVIGDFFTAEKLAKACDQQFNSSYEYEEDYLFVQFFQTYFLNRHDDILSAELLETIMLKHEKSCDGKINAQNVLMNSFIIKDSFMFNESFVDIINLRNKQFYERADFPPEFIDTDSKIFVAGIAIVRLANMRGLKPDQFQTIPSALTDITFNDDHVSHINWATLS